MDPGRGARKFRSIVHGAVLLAYVALLIVWIRPAESRSAQMRWLLLAGGAALAAGALVAPVRRACGRPARAVARVLDRALLATIAVVVASEIELRLLAKVVDSPLLSRPDGRAAERLAEQRLAPGEKIHDSYANALGFVDEEFRFEREEGTRRIAALGDSFLVGVVPYAENFATRLDVALDGPAGGTAPRCEVMNFGVFGASPRDYLHLYRTEVRHFEPDRVLVCLFVGNDLDYRRPTSLLHADALFAVSFVRRFGAWAAEAERQARASTRPGPPATHSAPVGYYGVGFTPEVFRMIETRRLEIFRRRPSREVALGYEQSMGTFEQMVAEIGPSLRVVLIPDELQVNDALYAEITRDGAEAFDRELPQRLLNRFFLERGVPVLDLLPVLREAERVAPTYQERDTHWGIHGNRVAAEAIAAWLRRPEVW